MKRQLLIVAALLTVLSLGITYLIIKEYDGMDQNPTEDSQINGDKNTAYPEITITVPVEHDDPNVNTPIPIDESGDNNATPSPNIDLPTKEPDDSSDIPISESPINTIVYVNSINDLKKSDLSIGQVVKTKGYYQSDDGGAASYKIITGEGIQDDGFEFIKLDNGLLAQISFEKGKYINVLCAGIRVNEKCSEPINHVINIVAGKVKGIQFNEGSYLIDGQINMLSMDYIGKNTRMVVTKDYKVKGNKVFTNYEAYLNNKYFSNINLSNIEFILETEKNHDLADKESILLCLMGIEGCKIDNCKFIAVSKDESGCYMPIDLIWFQNSNTKNVKIENSYFENCTVKKEDLATKLIGGCIWFSTQDKNGKIENIEISNCEFKTHTSDEIIAVWKAKSANNVNVHGCIFNVDFGKSDNILSFYNASFTNTKIDKCTFNINAPCLNVIKMFSGYDNDTFNVIIDSCNFYLGNGLKSPWNDNISIISIDGQKSSGNQYNISNCSFIGGEETQYRTIVSCTKAKDSIINFNRNEIKANVNSGVMWLADASVQVTISGSLLDLYVGNLMYINNIVNSKVLLDNNEIYSMIQGNFLGVNNLSYSFTNNLVYASKLGVLVNNVDMEKQNTELQVLYSNNKIESDSKLTYYYSQNKIPQDDVMQLEIK